MLDLLVLALLLFGAIRGGIRGLSGELAGVIAAVTALILAWHLSPLLSAWMTDHSRLDNQGALALTFTLTALFVIISGVILSFLFRGFIKLLIAKPLDIVSGIFAGITRMALILLIVFCIMLLVKSDYLNRTFGESATGQMIQEKLPDDWKNKTVEIWENSSSTVKNQTEPETTESENKD